MLLAQQKYIFSKFWNSVIKCIKCLRVTDRLAYQSPVPEFVEKNKYATSATDRSVVSTDVYHTLLFPWIAHAAASRADFMCSSD